MSDPEVPPPQLTPEQHDAVRRRALPVAICGLICGAAGLALLLMRTVNEGMPPSLFGVNLSFCAMLMGIGILYYARRTPGTRLAATACVLAILLGLGGTLLYFRQGTQWRVAMEQRELANVKAIAAAAQLYATENAGAYPPDQETLLKDGLLKPDQVHSPFGSDESMTQRKKLSPEKFQDWYRTHSDYLYFGGDLHIPVPAAQSNTQPASRSGTQRALPSSIIIACGKDPIMRKWISVVYADGRADFLDWGEAEKALDACNDAREGLGLPAIRPPEAVRKVQELEQQSK